MPRIYTTLLAMLCLTGGLSGETTYQMSQESCDMPFIIKNKLMLVRGQADSHSGYFLFDTGASELVLNKRFFLRKQGYRTGHIYADVHGRKARHGYSFISHFGWGSLERQNFYAPRLDLSALEAALGEEIIGIIGYDVLRHVEAEVDYYAGQMRLSRAGEGAVPVAEAPRPDLEFSFQLDGHLPVVRCAAGDAGSLLLGIDSGTSVNLMEIRLKKKLAGKAMQQRTIPLLGAGGQEKRAPYFVMESLEVEQAYSVLYSRVAFSDLSMLRNYGFRVDGLIGVNFFRLGRVAINYDTRHIRVWLGDNDYTMRLQLARPLPAISAG